MKKNLIIYLAIIAVLAVIICLIAFNKTEIKNEDATHVVEDSNLEILINLGNFNMNNYDDAKLLETAMQYAEKNGYMNESNQNGYIQYVNESDLHEIINELTGIQVEAPIQIEDFYYVYDSENEYYYYVPITTAPYEINNVEHIYKNDDIYTIETSIIKMQDGQLAESKNAKTELKYIEENSYAKYKIISQEIK